MPTPKVAEFNDNIKSMDATFLDVDARDPGFFTRDGLHYNKRGLGRLAATIKKWARENGHTHPADKKRTQCTVEKNRSIAAGSQSTAGKPWQTLRSCKPYNILKANS